MISKIRGASVVTLRKIFSQKNNLELLLFDNLSDDLKTIYLTAVTSTWSPLEKQVSLYETASQLLFPNAASPMFELGKLIATTNYTGIYAFLLRIPQPLFILKRMASIWQLHHNTGQFKHENYQDGSIDLLALNYPQLPRSLRVFISGQMWRVMELIGLQPRSIDLHEDTPEKWHWHVRWITKP